MSCLVPFNYSYLIKQSDLIPPSNHVHHARTLELLEQARLAFLDAIGYPFSKLADQGILLVITRIEIDYQRELLGGEIRVTCEQPSIKLKRLSLLQRVINPNAKEAICASIQFACLSTSLRRAVDAPKEFKERFCRI